MTKLPRMGILAISDADAIDELLTGLQELGWRDRENIEILYPAATPHERQLESNMKALVERGADIVVAQTKPAIRIAARYSDRLPIIMGAYNGDPIKDGLAETVARPGRNITGSFYNIHDAGARRVECLFELCPAARRVGVVHNPDSDVSLVLADEIIAAIKSRNAEVHLMPVNETLTVGSQFGVAKDKNVDAVISVTGAEMFAIRERMARAQRQYGLPTVMGSIGFPELGGLAKCGPEIPTLWRRMVPAISEIIAGRASASETPLISADAFQFDVSTWAAAELAITVSRATLAKAGRIIDKPPGWA